MASTSNAEPVHFRTAAVGGVDVFYREAGPVGAPVVLLLHGFPTSSRMGLTASGLVRVAATSGCRT